MLPLVLGSAPLTTGALIVPTVTLRASWMTLPSALLKCNRRPEAAPLTA